MLLAPQVYHGKRMQYLGIAEGTRWRVGPPRTGGTWRVSGLESRFLGNCSGVGKHLVFMS